ncbi:Panacea domain-containing protein [Spirillospora sp. NPDC050679]
MSAIQPPPMQPLLRSVLAVLKTAAENGHQINRTKLVKLLYLTDLAAVEAGGTPFTGATWRWGDDGPYDAAVRRAENTAVDSGLVDRDDQIRPCEQGSCRLALSEVAIDDPLDTSDTALIRKVVTEHGHKSADELRDLSHDTPPMIQATTAGDRGVLLDLSRARRARQTGALLDRFRRQRAAAVRRPDTPGVGDQLLAEMAGTAAPRGRVNAEELNDQ